MLTHVITGTCAGDPGFEARAGTRFRRRGRRRRRLPRSRPYKGELQKNTLRSRQHKGAKSGASPSPAPVVLRSRQHQGAKSGASPATTGTGTTTPTSNKNGNANHIATLYILKLPIVRFSGCYVIHNLFIFAVLLCRHTLSQASVGHA